MESEVPKCSFLFLSSEDDGWAAGLELQLAGSAKSAAWEGRLYFVQQHRHFSLGAPRCSRVAPRHVHPAYRTWLYACGWCEGGVPSDGVTN